MEFKILKTQGNLSGSIYELKDDSNLHNNNGSKAKQQHILNDMRRGEPTGHQILSIQLENGIIINKDENISYKRLTNVKRTAKVSNFEFVNDTFYIKCKRGPYAIRVKLDEIVALNESKPAKPKELPNQNLYSLQDIKTVLTPIIDNSELEQILDDFIEYQSKKEKIDTVIEKSDNIVLGPHPELTASLEFVTKTQSLTEEGIENQRLYIHSLREAEAENELRALQAQDLQAAQQYDEEMRRQMFEEEMHRARVQAQDRGEQNVPW